MKERTLWTVYLPDKSKDESLGVYDRLDDARRYGIALAAKKGTLKSVFHSHISKTDSSQRMQKGIHECHTNMNHQLRD